MKKIFTLVLCLSVGVSFSQKKKQKQDIDAILDMCGCYEISFNFAETFGAEKDYEYHKNYNSGGLEWIFPILMENDKIVLQHLLIVGDSMIVKHWRQDWLYENTDLYVYDKNNSWKYQKLDDDKVKGQWTQKVFQVDDSPRYEGSASWVHIDGRHYWENTADAPLPRREFSKRSDYNVMVRRNRHEITDYGWLHEQDNQKVLRENADRLLAKEKGWNTYTKTKESDCKLAQAWWSRNQQYWADVRSIWDEVFATQKKLELNMKVDNKIMFMRLFSLGKEVEGKDYNSDKTKQKIREVIQMHMKSDIKLANK